MSRFAAFLRGVMPTNARMPALRAAFEAAGFSDVATVLGSGNVLFTTRRAANATLERRADQVGNAVRPQAQRRSHTPGLRSPSPEWRGGQG